MSRSSPDRSQVFFMLISAGLFAYFGFSVLWNPYTATNPPQLIPMVVVLKWTLRAGAIAFGIAALATLAGSIFGPLLYAATGLVTAALFLVVAVVDLMNPSYLIFSPILLLVFAAWNGYGSWTGLQEVLAARERAREPHKEYRSS